MIWWFLFLLLSFWLIKLGFGATSFWWTAVLAFVWLFYLASLVTKGQKRAED